MRTVLAACGLLACTACGPTDRAVRVPRIAVEPASVRVDDVRYAVSTVVEVEVSNVGTDVAIVEVGGDLALATNRLQIAAGGATLLPLVLVPDSFEPIEGTVRLATGFQEVLVPVRLTVATDHDGDGADDVAAGGTDCDDGDPAVYPGAEERCDGLDNDCSGVVDDVAEPPVWHRDIDRDGHGDPDSASEGCEQPDGWVEDASDCDDLDANVFPGAPERDNLRDDDCDGIADEHLATRGELVFSEILIEPPASPGPAGAYVELANASGRRVALRGFELGVGSATASLPDVVVRPGAAVLLCADVDTGRNGGLDCAAGLPSVLDASGRVRLSVDGLALDEVDFSAWMPTAGASWELPVLDPDANDDATAWCVATTPFGDGYGSPGEAAASCR